MQTTHAVDIAGQKILRNTVDYSIQENHSGLSALHYID